MGHIRTVYPTVIATLVHQENTIVTEIHQKYIYEKGT